MGKSKPKISGNKLVPTKSIEPNHVYAHKKQVIFRDEQKHISIISLDDPQFLYQIDRWAAELFKSVDGVASVKTIYKKIEQASKLSEEIVQRRTQEVLSDLLAADLIELKQSVELR